MTEHLTGVQAAPEPASPPSSRRIPDAVNKPDGLNPPASLRPPGAAARGRRSPRLVVIGLLCSLVGGLGVSAAVQASQETSTVVAMARSVARGQKLGRADLTTVTIGSVPGLRTISSTEVAGLVGKTALVDLPASALVGEGMVGDPVMPRGTSHLGLRLEAGRLPTTALTPGGRVLLVEVRSSNAKAAEATEVADGPPRTFDATVVSSPRELPDGSTWVMDVSVPATSAADIANLAASGQVAVVKVA